MFVPDNCALFFVVHPNSALRVPQAFTGRAPAGSIAFAAEDHILAASSFAFDKIGAGKGWPGLLEHLSVVPAYILEVMSYSIGFSLMLAGLLATLIAYVHVDETRTSWSRWSPVTPAIAR